MATNSISRQCIGVTRSGSRCRHYTRNPNGWCGQCIPPATLGLAGPDTSAAPVVLEDDYLEPSEDYVTPSAVAQTAPSAPQPGQQNYPYEPVDQWPTYGTSAAPDYVPIRRRQHPIYTYLVYIAHPIDLSHDPQDSYLQRVRQAVERQHLPWVVLDPEHATSICSGATQMDDCINHLNEAQQAAAQGVLAFVPTDAASVGTPIEIATAYGRGQPCAVVTDSHSWVLAGFEHTSNGRLRVCTDLDQAVGWLHKAMGQAAREAARRP